MMRFSQAGFNLIAVIVFYLCGAATLDAAETQPSRIKVGYPSPSASFYPLFATKEAGLFPKYGFDAELVYVQGVQLIQVHVAGQLDFSVISGVVFLQASVAGADLIAIASSIDKQLMKVMAHPSISGPADLRGKTIAVTRFGSLTDLLLRPALVKWGLDPKKDVTLIQIGSMSDIATAVSLKKVEAGVISFPSSYHGEKMGLKTLLDFGEVGTEIPATNVVVSRRFSKSHRDTVLRFLKAYIEGTQRLLTDRQLGIRALAKYGGIKDQELLATTYNLFTSKYIKKVPFATVKGIENALALLAEANPKVKERRPEEFIDTSFMDELEKAGFVKSIWP
ncbi:MAG: ABC transporter substrate-binding protein [Deltaproteobacteria bacterium]|nr:ABC transporter substrate-binding protein [Deltaproteobacteria bacterium]